MSLTIQYIKQPVFYGFKYPLFGLMDNIVILMNPTEYLDYYLEMSCIIDYRLEATRVSPLEVEGLSNPADSYTEIFDDDTTEFYERYYEERSGFDDIYG